jgi:hypothetical protein
VPGSNAPMAGGLFLVTMIPRATILGNALTKESSSCLKMLLLRECTHKEKTNPILERYELVIGNNNVYDE